MADIITGPGKYVMHNGGIAEVVDVRDGKANGWWAGYPYGWICAGGHAYHTNFVGLTIIKPYVEPPRPLEIWANIYSYNTRVEYSAYDKEANAVKLCGPNATRKAVHFREVIIE